MRFMFILTVSLIMVATNAAAQNEFSNNSDREAFQEMFMNLAEDYAEQSEHNDGVRDRDFWVDNMDNFSNSEAMMNDCLSKSTNLSEFDKKLESIALQRSTMILKNTQSLCQSGKSGEEVKNIIDKKNYDLLSTVLSEKELSIYKKCEAEISSQAEINVCAMYY